MTSKRPFYSIRTGSIQRREEGYAIVAAIWLAGLALIVATEFSLRVRSNVLLSAQSVHAATLSAAAGGMVRLTAWRLSTGKDIQLNGEARLCSWNDTTDISVTVQDHAGLIDLNAADITLYRLLLEGVGIDSARARKLADEIVDYRDPDTNALTGGAEGTLRNGAPFKNAPFETVEELDLLPSISDDIYWKLKAHFTTMSGIANLDPSVMALTAKAALSQKAQPYYAPSQRRAFRITVSAHNKGGSTVSIASDVLLILQPDRPFSIITWNAQPNPATFTASHPESPSCFT
jgi:general secretion pathway protein K